MIDIPTIADLNLAQLLMLITHIIISFTIIVHLSFVYIQKHAGFMPEQNLFKNQLCCYLKSHELLHLSLGFFTLVHIGFLTTYLFGFNVGIMLEINLLIIFIAVLTQLKERRSLAGLAILFSLFSFITIKGPFYQFLSQLF